ncbi:hypothetical protein PR202_ga21139 [Eleusine coracana subsp. coracana]|uniref:Late embryogenesis abundant protein n=1 Tax=Eleusine coracana subsp. coracana TaxID=191504 RepID=A0AAV5D0L6_ELECO|nr:hypothetical protein QOZ80_8AG0632810 [Eleusine coracana subsp. coracana]GJN03668.1 hypothetical protein PR202_ga21139 [Eleusine coracana subsp. coracana]
MAARAILSSRLAGLQVAARNYGRRTYGTAAAEAVAKQEPVNLAAAKVRQPTAAEQAVMRKEECSWMRDPKTGCWMPENHIDDVDAADLRARLIFSKKD